jgi:hypothetical protein
MKFFAIMSLVLISTGTFAKSIDCIGLLPTGKPIGKQTVFQGDSVAIKNSFKKKSLEYFALYKFCEKAKLQNGDLLKSGVTIAATCLVHYDSGQAFTEIKPFKESILVSGCKSPAPKIPSKRK